ncbi:cupin domain-containing protein [Aspergillus homomorphus CBS 101889]|uniref:Cupin type-1 domain-containing protein n=1 Tax=Aspergillus homomorphus (strain CBS 101889) TaxID=1450537 RepID=A0A395HNB8_ASPHC|nr:hypothetical protein BO97DRAFT_459577 [Aspergillus homomorphus CBS 101889]RAL09116.1 hypothetical protein BO97DRAFT_459577 [Aspergillus homomorphus CBS 101889]
MSGPAIIQVPPELHPIPPTSHSPNSPFPVIVYRGALLDRTPTGALEAMETSEWPQGGHWKIGREKVAATPHYHATTHEAYTVLHGSGTYLLGQSPLDPETDEEGKPVGVKFTASAGDVFVFPAGVTHFVTDTNDDYEIIGFYSLNAQNSRENPYDMEFALDSVEETELKRQKCRQVPVPVHDPIYGKDGPIPRIWRGE